MRNILNMHTPPGFFYFPNFVNEDEEQILIEKISSLDWQEVRMHGIVAKRKVVHFGMNYLYSQRNAVQSNTVIPKFLNLFIQRASVLMHIDPDKIIQVLVSKYPIGAGIGWHTDAEVFGDKVFGISLLNPCTMKFRKRTNHKYSIINAELASRSGYILSGDARFVWQHSIPPVKLERYSITFRTLK